MDILAFFFLFGLLFHGLFVLARHLRDKFERYPESELYLRWSDDTEYVNLLATVTERSESVLAPVAYTSRLNEVDYLRTTLPPTNHYRMRPVGNSETLEAPALQRVRSSIHLANGNAGLSSVDEGRQIFMASSLGKTA